MILAHGAGGLPELLPALPLLVAGAAYVGGLSVLTLRGVAWPPGRAAAYVLGLVVLAVALLPPVALRDDDFRVHVAQHLLLTALAPVLLALGAPVTLALRVLRGGARRRLLAVVHSRAARSVASPAVVLALQAGSAWLLYATPLYAATLRSEGLHVVVHGHMLVVGLLFAAVLVGADPLPRRRTSLRLGVLVLAAAAHDVLAKTVYARGVEGVALPAARDGARLLYYGGDAATVLLAVVLLAGWYARSGRELAREQRRAASAAS